MIGHLRGVLLRKTPQEVLLETAGVGYRVTIPVSTYYRLPAEGGTAALHIHTHVREDALALFGFASEPEQKLFELLISISGVGPRLAVNILSGIEPADLAAALRGGDLARLTRIPGVGKKTAERLVVELKDKLASFSLPTAAETAGGAAPLDNEDLVSALANLGYARPEAERAIRRAAQDQPRARFEDLLRRSLQLLSGR